MTQEKREREKREREEREKKKKLYYALDLFVYMKMHTQHGEIVSMSIGGYKRQHRELGWGGERDKRANVFFFLRVKVKRSNERKRTRKVKNNTIPRKKRKPIKALSPCSFSPFPLFLFHVVVPFDVSHANGTPQPRLGQQQQQQQQQLCCSCCPQAQQAEQLQRRALDGNAPSPFCVSFSSARFRGALPAAENGALLIFCEKFERLFSQAMDRERERETLGFGSKLARCLPA